MFFKELKKMHYYLSNKKSIIISLYFFLFQVLAATFFSVVASKLYNSGINKGFVGFSNPLEEFLISVLLGPVLETWIFQLLPIEYFKKKLDTFYPGIFCSTILFALAHMYNLIYFINALVAGFIFAYFYCIMKVYKTHPFIWLASLHALYNLFVFSLKYI